MNSLAEMLEIGRHQARFLGLIFPTTHIHDRFELSMAFEFSRFLGRHRSALQMQTDDRSRRQLTAIIAIDETEIPFCGDVVPNRLRDERAKPFRQVAIAQHFVPIVGFT